MNANGTNQTRLTTDPFASYADQRPAWSPNGSRIAFASFRDSQNEIYVMDAVDANNDGNGDNLTRLTNNPALDTKPDFSPNGTRIAFHSDRDEGNGVVEIYTMEAVDADNNGEGDNLSRLVAGFGRNPSWSPDGTSIAFFGSLTNGDIFTVSAGGGGTPTNLTNTADPIFEAWPSWGPRPSDTTPPETILDTSGPSGTVDGASATFTFSSEPNAAFDCKLDNGRFEICESPKTYNDLSKGQHRFEVRATDTPGNTDASPEIRTWTIDSTPTVLDNSSSLEPDRGATSVARNTEVSATFSEEMKPETITSSTFKLQQYNKETRKWTTIPATITLSNSNKTATLDPYPSDPARLLAANKKFRGFITTGAKDLAGNPLASNFVWIFRTGSI